MRIFSYLIRFLTVFFLCYQFKSPDLHCSDEIVLKLGTLTILVNFVIFSLKKQR